MDTRHSIGNEKAQELKGKAAQKRPREEGETKRQRLPAGGKTAAARTRPKKDQRTIDVGTKRSAIDQRVERSKAQERPRRLTSTGPPEGRPHGKKRRPPIGHTIGATDGRKPN